MLAGHTSFAWALQRTHATLDKHRHAGTLFDSAQRAELTPHTIVAMLDQFIVGQVKLLMLRRARGAGVHVCSCAIDG
jgi:hypothetical protein